MGKEELINIELEGKGKIKCPMCSNEVFINSIYLLNKPFPAFFEDAVEVLRCDDCNYLLFFHTEDSDTSYMEDSDHKKRKQLKIIPIRK